MLGLHGSIPVGCHRTAVRPACRHALAGRGTSAGLYPDITVESDPIFVHDGQVWTSAGATAAIDLTLALVQEDLGHSVAMQAAKMLVVYLQREGGQSQFSVPLSLQTAAAPEFASLHAWMRENIGEELHIESLADRAAMSPRNFQRVYTAKVGRTPAKTVELLRLEAACRALEHGALRLKANRRGVRFWRRTAASPRISPAVWRESSRLSRSVFQPPRCPRECGMKCS